MFYEIDNSLINQEDPDIHARWFRDTQVERDLFVWKNSEDEVIRFQLTYSDVVVEWDEANDIRTGRLSSGERVGFNSSETFNFHDEPDERIMRYVKRIIRRFESTDEDLTLFIKKIFLEG